MNGVHESTDWSREFRPLRGLHVVEWGTSISVSVAGWVLSGLGASVEVFSTPPSVNHEHAGPGATSETTIRRSVSKGKIHGERNERDVFEVVSQNAPDVVLMDLEQGSPVGPVDETLAKYLGAVGSSASLVWVSISPFGLTGPSRGRAGHELVYLAASGLLAYTRGGDDELVVPAGFQASIASGHVAALAVVHGLSIGTGQTGTVHMDVSCQEAVLSTSVPLEVAHSIYELAGEPGTKRYGPPRGLLACGDGHVYLSVLENHHWDGLKDALGRPGWSEEIPDLAMARARGEEISARLTEWAATRNRREIVELVQSHGVPATAVMSCQELLDDDDYRDRGFFAPVSEAIRELVPGNPFLSRCAPADSADPGFPVRRSLQDCQVADLSHVLAGPLASSWLGAMGADVVRLEETHRLDIYRRLGPRPASVAASDPQALEMSGYFAAVNHSKRSVTSSSDQDDRGRIRLMRSADVIIENLSEHRRRQVALDFDSIRGVNRRASVISSSGFGRSSRRAGYRVYGTNLHCHCGIVYHTRDRSGNVCNIGAAAWADPLTSIWVALLAAVAFLTGAEGCDFDLSMAEVASRHLVDHFFVASGLATNDAIETVRPPFGYLNAGDGTVMVMVRDESEWRELRAWLEESGAPVSGEDPEQADWRTAVAAGIDRLSEVSLALPGAAVEEALIGRGLLAQEVLDAYRLSSDPHLEARRFFEAVDHRAWGTQRIIGLPWRLAGEGPIAVRPTPILGEHDQEWWADPSWDAETG